MELNKLDRIVIKVGSSLIAPNGDGCSTRYLLSIANFIIRCQLMETEVILVSSGSVAAGRSLFSNEATTVGNVTLKKAMAAAGQTEMMAAWNKLVDCPTAQLLLTQHDLQQHERFLSISETVENLLDNNVLPIINENDAVTTEISKVGDNDNLSAMVASALGADALIICSDIDGLFDSDPRKNPNAQFITDVEEITPEVMDMAGGSQSDVGTGGMRTKIVAARKATESGIPTIIMNGYKEDAFDKLLKGKNPGTLFHPNPNPLDKKIHWLTYGSRARGELVVNENAINKQTDETVHIEYEDIVDVVGEFAAGDTVIVKHQNGERIAKAQVESGSCLLQHLTSQEQSEKAKVPSNAETPSIVNFKEVTLLEE